MTDLTDEELDALEVGITGGPQAVRQVLCLIAEVRRWREHARGDRGVAICDGCFRSYVREGRAPQRGRRNFCPDCGLKAAQRLAKRDQRARPRLTTASGYHPGADGPEGHEDE